MYNFLCSYSNQRSQSLNLFDVQTIPYVSYTFGLAAKDEHFIVASGSAMQSIHEGIIDIG